MSQPLLWQALAARRGTVVLIFEDRSEMVIHAMPCRKKHLDLLP